MGREIDFCQVLSQDLVVPPCWGLVNLKVGCMNKRLLRKPGRIMELFCLSEYKCQQNAKS